MQIGLGPRKQQEDIVDLLLACHERIRGHATMARRLAEATDAPEDQIAAAAGAVHRYFAEALPLHVADEEESLTPRLRGVSQAVDDALARMTAEHREHGPWLARLVDTCAALAQAPARHAELAPTIAEAAAWLAPEFEKHLASEETILFPAIRASLSLEVRRGLVDELRARRARG